MADGWIKLHRALQEHWIWTEKPFTKGQAWIDILLMANHADNQFLFNGLPTEVKKGGFITSELKLMERWGWSKTKVRGFLKLLQNDEMIQIITDKKKTAINVVNYTVYQANQTTKKPQGDHRKTTKRPQKDTNKNEKNEKNEKKKNNTVRHPSPKGGAAGAVGELGIELEGTIANPIPKGMSVEEYERRKAEARL